MNIEEVNDQVVRFAAFGEARVIPETMIESLENYQLSLVTRTKKRPVHDSGTAHHHIPRAAQEKRWRHAVQIGEERGEYGAFRICTGHIVGDPRSIFWRRAQVAGPPHNGIDCARVAYLAEVSRTSKYAQSTGHG